MKVALAFIEERLTSMRKTDCMWGGLEAIEMQAITLIELEAMLRIGSSAREILEKWQYWIKDKYPGHGKGRRALVSRPEAEALMQELLEFRWSILGPCFPMIGTPSGGRKPGVSA